MKEIKKWLIPLIVGSLLSIAVGVYGISIIPRIERNERGIDRLIELVMEVREDISWIKGRIEKADHYDLTD